MWVAFFIVREELSFFLSTLFIFVFVANELVFPFDTILNELAFSSTLVLFFISSTTVLFFIFTALMLLVVVTFNWNLGLAILLESLCFVDWDLFLLAYVFVSHDWELLFAADLFEAAVATFITKWFVSFRNIDVTTFSTTEVGPFWHFRFTPDITNVITYLFPDIFTRFVLFFNTFFFTFVVSDKDLSFFSAAWCVHHFPASVRGYSDGENES